jgi:hypothetical protein
VQAAGPVPAVVEIPAAVPLPQEKAQVKEPKSKAQTQETGPGTNSALGTNSNESKQTDNDISEETTQTEPSKRPPRKTKSWMRSIQTALDEEKPPDICIKAVLDATKTIETAEDKRECFLLFRDVLQIIRQTMKEQTSEVKKDIAEVLTNKLQRMIKIDAKVKW